MYHRGMKWEEYLEHKGFKDDIVHGLERQTRAMAAGQAAAARRTAAAQRDAAYEIADAEAMTTQALQQGFGRLIAGQYQMTAVMQGGFAAVSYGLEQVSGGIAALRADFNWAMGAVLWKLEMQHATLRNILATLQAPLDTQAIELRQRAEDAYLHGWYAEALSDFLESEQKNYQDFAVHQAIGNIYLYKRQPADLDKAHEYYLKAAKYGTPRSAYHAALGYMHAGFVCYLQGDDAAAIENAQRATELYPQLIEAFYNHAKFAAVAGQPARAIPSLETAIRADRNYAVKARADADFEHIEAAVRELMEQLRAEARQQAEAQWQPLQREINRYEIAPQEQAQLERAQAEFEALMKQDTYFAYLDAPAKVRQCRKVFDGLRLPERERLRDEAATLLSRPRGEMADYVMPDAFREQLNGELATAERLLSGVPTYADARAARDKAGECERQWKAAASQTVLKVLKGHTGSVDAVTFSPDGATLASCGDKTVRLWDARTGRARAGLKEHTSSVRTIALSPDGATLASGSDDSTVRLWNARAGRARAVLKGHTGPVNVIAFSPDGAMLASGSGDRTVRLWDTAAALSAGARAGRERALLKGHTGSVDAVAFSLDGATLASCGDKTVRLWDVRAGREQAVLKGHTGLVDAIAFSPDGATLASCGDKTVRLWDVRAGRERAVLKGHDYVNAVAFSPDGATLASCSADKTVRLWDARTGRERAVLRGHTGSVKVVAFSPDGAMLASCSADKTVRLWDARAGREWAVLKGHTKWVNAIAFSPDGATLASGSRDSTVRLWGLVVHKNEWARMEQKEREKWEREKREREEREREEREREEREQQRQVWRAAGRCEECGAKLGLRDKLGRKTRCKRHRL